MKANGQHVDAAVANICNECRLKPEIVQVVRCISDDVHFNDSHDHVFVKAPGPKVIGQSTFASRSRENIKGRASTGIDRGQNKSMCSFAT